MGLGVPVGGPPDRVSGDVGEHAREKSLVEAPVALLSHNLPKGICQNGMRSVLDFFLAISKKKLKSIVTQSVLVPALPVSLDH